MFALLDEYQCRHVPKCTSCYCMFFKSYVDLAIHGKLVTKPISKYDIVYALLYLKGGALPFSSSLLATLVAL